MENIVHIVDDDESVRTSLSDYLHIQGINNKGHACAEDFLGNMAMHDRGCVLVDVRMPGMNGLELHQEMERRSIFLPVIMMTGQANVDLAVKAMKEGVMDFIEKPLNLNKLLHSVRTCIAKCDDFHERGIYRGKVASFAANLTKREKEVMKLLVDGNQNKEIAKELNISPRTVELHRAKVMEKLHAHTISDVVRAGIILSTENLYQ